LGDAVVASNEDASALFWNPAGLQGLARGEVLFQHEIGLEDAATDLVGVARPVWWGRGRRTWGASLVRRSAGAVDVVEDESSLGRATPSEGQAAFSLAGPLGPWAGGVTVKWIYQATFQKTSQSAALDFGLSGVLGSDRLRWGAAAANLGTPLRPGGTRLPLVIRSGVSYLLSRRETGRWRDRWTLLAEWDVRAGDRAALHGGLDYGVRLGTSTLLHARLGARSDREAAEDRLSAGFGWENDDWRVNYAFAPAAAPGAFHRVDVGRRFGATPAPERRRDELWRDARTYVAEGRWLAARATLDELRGLSPGFYPARRLSAQVASRMEQSLDPETLYLLGHAALDDGDPERAQDFLRKLLIVKPEHAEGRAALHRAEGLSAERRDERLRAQVARERRREAEALAVRARALSGSGRWVDALGVWESRATRDPAGARAGLEEALDHVAALADGAEREGRLETARDLLRRVAAHRDVAARLSAVEKRWADGKRERGRALYAEGLKAYMAGDRRRAGALFQEALTLMPSDPALRRAVERLNEDVTP
jgi:tetratricopeptide (TPR) repeat protein